NVARRCGTGHCMGLLQSTLREDVAGGCCTQHCTAHCIGHCKGMLQRAMPLAGCELGQGVAWGSGMGKLCGALHGSIAQHCKGTLHRAGKRGSPTTDPIPIPTPAQPQVCIIPAETGNARVPVTVIWLHNRDIVEPDDYNPISAIPNGDWTYQTQVSLLVAPVAGDTYTCSVQHVSLQEPLLEDWSEWRGAGPHPEAGGLGSFLPFHPATRAVPHSTAQPRSLLQGSC
uniref:Immunoglobulin C1-set domain-containing protein n=1 Tax=Anas platyrhynchos platyrhynchos TaxID=8840 RepID=A0A493U3A8_ANAPP